MTTTTTELAPVAAGIIALAQHDESLTMEGLALLLVPAISADETAARPFPGLPKDVELTPAARDALARVEQVFGSVSIKDRRSLTAEEVERASDEAVVLSVLEKILKARVEYLREMMRVHMDVDAEETAAAISKSRRGVSATQRNLKGHYLLASAQKAAEVIVKGFTTGWKQIYVSGGVKVSPSGQLLRDLRDQDVITQREYLGITRADRPFDSGKMMTFIRKNPERGPAILRALTTREEPNSQLTLPVR
jgi:hypothetical protein